MIYAALILFTLTSALGVYLLAQAFRGGGEPTDYVSAAWFTAGSVLMMVAALWVIIRERRNFRPSTPQPARPDPKLSRKQKMVLALVREIESNHDRAGEQLEKFETTGDLAACDDAERRYRIAIQASRRIPNCEQGDYDFGMSLSLAYLLRLRDRREESKQILRDVVDFYKQRASDAGDSGRYMNNWRQAREACEDLAEMLREDGDDDIADMLEEQGRIWVETFIKGNEFYPSAHRNTGK